MCDKDPELRVYFSKHLENMNKTDLAQPYIMNDNMVDFFEEINRRIDEDQDDVVNK